MYSNRDGGVADRTSLRAQVRRVVGSLRRSFVGMLGVGLVSLLLLTAALAPVISPHDPRKHDLPSRFQPPGYSSEDATYLLGTDQLGRDILSRIIHGSRVSVVVGVLSVLVAGTIGVAYGIVAGFLGGWVNAVMMRVADALLGIPFIILVVAIAGVLGPGISTLILVLGFTGWVTYARVTCGEVLAVREREYVLSARAIGQTAPRIMQKHILPNVVQSAIVLAALQVGVTILAESSLSFLGLGVQPPAITWGLILADGRQYVGSAWWMSTFPGIAITLTVLGTIFLGDWVRDVLDPHLRGRD